MDPLLIDVPPAIETARLVLRCPRAGDGPAVSAAVCETLEALKPWMPWAQAAPTPEDSELVCRRMQVDFLARRDLPLLVFERAGGRLVGGTGLHRMDWAVRRFEIGYWTRSGATGRGYAVECVQALTDLCFARLAARRVEIRADARNAASRAVAERAGFTLEGVLRRDSLAPDGAPRDTAVYARIA